VFNFVVLCIADQLGGLRIKTGALKDKELAMAA
jgi:hypothetical protein